MTISSSKSKELKAEETRYKKLHAQQAMRRDAKLVMPPKTRNRRPDTPEVIAERLRIKVWADAHKDLVAKNQKVRYEKRTSEAKARIAQAIAQDEATQRNVTRLTDEIEDAQ